MLKFIETRFVDIKFLVPSIKFLIRIGCGGIEWWTDKFFLKGLKKMQDLSVFVIVVVVLT